MSLLRSLRLVFIGLALLSPLTLSALPNGTQTILTTSGFTDLGATLAGPSPDNDFVLSGKNEDTSAALSLAIGPVGNGQGAYITGATNVTYGSITVAANGTTLSTFELTAAVFDEFTTNNNYQITVIGTKPDNTTISSNTATGSGTGGSSGGGGGPDTYAVSFANFSGVQLKSFTVVIDGRINGRPGVSAATVVGDFSLVSFTVANAQAPDTTPPTISIGAPSASLTRGGPVSYTVTYSDANFASSTLAPANITLNATGTASATIGVSGSGTTRTVTLSSITGDGTLGISIAAGTASDTAGNTAPAAGPSSTFTVDNTAPLITSALTASGTYDSAISTYTITASGSPVSFGASGLPAGLSVNTGTGAITGTPTQSGPFSVTISAADSAGNLGTATLALNIAPKTLSVTGVTAANKTYDGTTAASLGFGSASLVGVRSGDTVTLSTGSATGAFADKNVGTGKTVTVSGLALGGVSAGNYTLTQPTAAANITRAPLTVTADAKTRPYGYANPAFTATITGFVGGDTAGSAITGSPSLSTAANAASTPGAYSITAALGTLASTNYSFTFAAGTLTVRKLVLDDWRAENFNASELLDSNISGPLADPDSDGLANLVEFAFGTDPRNAASGPAPLVYAGTLAGSGTLTTPGQPLTLIEGSGSGADFGAVFIRRAPAFTEGPAYTLQFSADLSSWQDSSATPAVLATDGLLEVVTVPYPILPGDQNRRFFRVRVAP